MFKTYVTSKYEKYRLESVPVESNDKPDFTISINRNKRYQKIIGFGGAFTEAACFTLNRLSQEKQDTLLMAYFDEVKGLGYNLGRVHMNSSDFSLENYCYVEDNDTNLESFNISREYKYVIPTIKKAEAIAMKDIKLLISPWSPPWWMKSNKMMNQGGYLLPDYYSVWAEYYVKFIDALKDAGLKPFALTVQNEPAAVQTWDSCIYTAEQERDFIKNFLGPILHENSHKDIKVFIWDHNRDIVVERAKTVLTDKEAAKYVSGTAVHWYVSEEFENLGIVHKLFPKKQIIFSEGCVEGGPQVNVYETGERYSRNIIGDFSNWCEAFIDWNITLDELGGPNHVGNYCDAPILSDTVNNKLIFNSSYYHIGHFSKYVKPGAYRIQTRTRNKLIKQIAFENPDGSIVLVCLNQSEKDIVFKFKFNGLETNFKSIKRSIMTLIYKGDWE